MAKIGIQLGHCYRTSGVTGTPGCCGETEQDYVTRLYNALSPKLQAAGHTPVKILADPTSYPVVDAFFALHCDGSLDTSLRGCSFGYRTDRSNAAISKALGDKWRQQHHTAGYPGGDRPTNYTAALAQYYALDKVYNMNHGVRAVVVECGFLTNKPDNDWLITNVNKVADGFVHTVTYFFGGTTTEEDEFMSFLDLPESEQDQIIDRFWMRLARGEKVDGTFPAHMVAVSLGNISDRLDLTRHGDSRGPAFDSHDDESVEGANKRAQLALDQVNALWDAMALRGLIDQRPQ